jgi:hypothetical protein
LNPFGDSVEAFLCMHIYKSVAKQACIINLLNLNV